MVFNHLHADNLVLLIIVSLFCHLTSIIRAMHRETVTKMLPKQN